MPFDAASVSVMSSIAAINGASSAMTSLLESSVFMSERVMDMSSVPHIIILFLSLLHTNDAIGLLYLVVSIWPQYDDVLGAVEATSESVEPRSLNLGHRLSLSVGVVLLILRTRKLRSSIHNDVCRFGAIRPTTGALFVLGEHSSQSSGTLEVAARKAHLGRSRG